MESINTNIKYPKKGLNIDDLTNSIVIVNKVLIVKNNTGKYQNNFIEYLIENEFTLVSTAIFKNVLKERTEKEAKFLGMEQNVTPSQLLYEVLDVYSFYDYPEFEELDKAKIFTKIMTFIEKLQETIYAHNKKKIEDRRLNWGY